MGRAGDRNRRLDSDAGAVQVITVREGKGLQYPSCSCRSRPTASSPSAEPPLPPRRAAVLDIGGKGRGGSKEFEALARPEPAADDIWLMYVALTRAQPGGCVVGADGDEPHLGLPAWC